MLFDRFGARRTVPVVLTAAIAGSLIYGFADGEAMLIAGRVLLGTGCSGVLMGSLFLFGQWAPPASFSTWMGADDRHRRCRRAAVHDAARRDRRDPRLAHGLLGRARR